MITKFGQFTYAHSVGDIEADSWKIFGALEKQKARAA